MADLHVTLYSGPETPEMAEARRFLQQREIRYEEKNVAQSSGARGELTHHAGRVEYPSINVDGHLVLGFVPEKWDHLLQPTRRQGGFIEPGGDRPIGAEARANH